MQILNSYHLKIIALTTMLIDHIGIMFFPEMGMLRIIGRIAFVLYAFMLAEGFFYTKNLNKYIYKVFLWSFLSEIPFDLAIHGKWFYFGEQNIFFSLLIGLLGMKFIKQDKSIFGKITIMVLCVLVAILLRVDYSWYGVLLIFVFYLFREYGIKYFIGQGLNIAAAFKLLSFQFFAFLGFLPVLLYNGNRGRKIGDIYYSFYALHLVIFNTIKYLYHD